MTSQKFGNRI